MTTTIAAKITPTPIASSMHPGYTQPFPNITRAQQSGMRFEACVYCDEVLLIGDAHPDEWVVKKWAAWDEHLETEQHKDGVERTKPASARKETVDA